MALAVWSASGLAAVVMGCASSTHGSIAPPTEEQREAAARDGFEVRPVRRAVDLVTPDRLAGPYYEVGSEVLHDGRANVYSISSEFGDFEAIGDEQLDVRLREIEALAAMRATSKTATFAAAAGRALTSPFVASWNLVTHPVDSVLGVPVAAWNAINHTAQLATADRSEFEDSALVAVIGFEARKRSLAAELGVDPYSSNKALQKQLNRLAWAAYAGSLPTMFVPFVREAAADEAGEERLAALLRTNSPAGLRRLNRIELAVMGVSGPMADAFIGHRWYSPRCATVLVASLAALDLTENRVAFIEAAITAESEADARMFAQTARLLQEYDEHGSGVGVILRADNHLMGYTDDQTLVLPLAADYVIWNSATADFVEVARQPLPDQRPVAKTALVAVGTVSELTRRKLEANGIEITERGLDHFGADPVQSVHSVQKVDSSNGDTE